MDPTPDDPRAALVPFRARAARLASQVSWALLAATALAGLRADAIQELRVWAPLAAMAVTLVALSLVDWHSALTHRRGDFILTLWAALTLTTIAVVSTAEPMANVALTLYFVVVVFSAVLASPVSHLIITAVAGASYSLAPLAYGSTRSFEDLLIPMLTLLIVALVSARIAAEFRGATSEGVARLQELSRQETDFERLYQVSTTISAGSSLEGVLPELVGRIGKYLNAQVGLIVLHDASRQVLNLVNPVWTAGYSLEIEGYTLSVTGNGEIERAFKTGSAGSYEGMAADPDAHSILGELGVDTAMCVPLRVETRTIGVMVVADKADGAFGDEDLETFISLAAPAALVLAQLERIEEAAESTRRMEELAKMKTDFVSVVSHELRTPLTSIIGSLATLSRPELAPNSAQGVELLTSAQRQADRLRRLIEDLLMISRIEHRSLPQHPKRIELEKFLRELVSEIPTQGRSVKIDVSQGAEWLEADPDHLSRIVINLIDNAIKYAPSSPIEVMADRDRNRMTIAVIDHGSGIELADRDRAFERFGQLEPSQTRSQGGAGLGLSIVRGLVQVLGGRLDLYETPGGGATFVVSVPHRPGIHGESGDPTPLASSQ